MKGPLEVYVGIWSDLLRYNDYEVNGREFALSLLLGTVIMGGLLGLLIRLDLVYMLTMMAVIALIDHAAVYTYLLLGVNTRATKLEEVLPDFLSLVASNIKSGLTPDKALLISARPEFGPLSKAVTNAGKSSITGMPFDQVLLGMCDHIKSDVLEKTMRLVVEGIHSGGDMAELLDKTAYDLRKFRSVRREVNSIILNYELFIMAAVSFGAPLLYGVATFLVEIMVQIKKQTLSGGEALAAVGQVSMFRGNLAVTPEAISLFAMIGVTITVFFGCMAVGVMSSGKKEDGLKYFPLLLGIALGILLGIRSGLESILGPLIASG